MTNEQAIELMKTSTSVDSWNANRDVVRHAVTQKQWESLHYPIDAFGLITQVLGKDEPKQKFQTKKITSYVAE